MVYARMLSHSGLSPVEYSFVTVDYEVKGKKEAKGEKKIALPLNSAIGKKISLVFTGEIRCVSCGAVTKKSFNQGACYKCFITLAENDMCILRPDTCHFHQGTCREPEWGKAQCFKKHSVYLANTSGLKVGITKENPVSKRWVDQGAVQALAIYETESRLEAGLVESEFAKFISDKTSWQKMISGNPEKLDLKKEFQKLTEKVKLDKKLTPLSVKETEILYPVQDFPKKKVHKKFEAGTAQSDILVGIKGQYLLFETGVMNVRNYEGYSFEIEIH